MQRDKKDCLENQTLKKAITEAGFAITWVQREPWGTAADRPVRRIVTSPVTATVVHTARRCLPTPITLIITA
jgi:hypothetical protein